MFKIIKEMLPPDVRVARDAQDLLVECCVGMKKVMDFYAGSFTVHGAYHPSFQLSFFILNDIFFPERKRQCELLHVRGVLLGNVKHVRNLCNYEFLLCKEFRLVN